jgi:serine O-acetyltransferase
MIKSKKDAREFIEEDAKANGYKWPLTMKNKILYVLNPRLRYHVLLRKYELYYNLVQSGKNYYIFHKFFYYYLFKKCGYKCGYSIAPNSFESGLCICHVGTLVVNNDAKIGKNCRIHVGVNIGGYKNGVPVIGNNVYIGPGAKIFGGIHIGNNVKIGANAVVNKSVPDDVSVAGIPAKIIG